MPESHLQTLYESRNPDLRAGDHDRDAVADILREQHVAGRLDTDELQERIDRCFAAKTYGELRELVTDLPHQRLERPVARAWSLFRLAPLLLLPLVIGLAGLSHGHALWLVIPLFFFVVRPLLWRGRLGWGFAGCGPRRSSSPGDYV